MDDKAKTRQTDKDIIIENITPEIVKDWSRILQDQGEDEMRLMIKVDIHAILHDKKIIWD